MTDETDTPHLHEAGTGNPRHVSKAQLELLLGKARGTVDGWMRKADFPIVRRADRDRGITWLFDIAAVVEWLENRAAEGAAAKFAHLVADPTDADGSQAEAERLLAWTRYWREDLKLQADRKEVVRVDAVVTMIAGEYADLRTALESLPNKMAVDLAGVDSPEEIQELLADEVRKTLRNLRGRIRPGMRPADEEPDPEPSDPPIGDPPKPKGKGPVRKPPAKARGSKSNAKGA